MPYLIFFGASGYLLKRKFEKALPNAASYLHKNITKPLVICLVIFEIPLALLLGIAWMLGHVGP